MLHVLRRLWSKPTGKTEMVCDRCGSVLHEDDLGVSLNAEEYNMVICSKCLLDKNFTDVCFLDPSAVEDDDGKLDL